MSQYGHSSFAIIDTRFTIETPEGTDLPLEPAGMGVRIMAFMIDWLIKTGIMIAFSTLLAFAGKMGMGLLLIAFFMLEWFYPVVFEVWRGGQTPGKRSYKLRVVSEDGTPITFAASLIRNLLRFVDFMPFAYMTGIISSQLSHHFQRIGDMAAATLVVYEYQTVPLPQIDSGDAMAAPADFTTDEQRVLLNFAERCQQLSADRQRELANILQPVINQPDPVVAIKSMAKGLVVGA